MQCAVLCPVAPVVTLSLPGTCRPRNVSAPLSGACMGGGVPSGRGMFMLKIFVLDYVHESSDLYWGRKLPFQ